MFHTIITLAYIIPNIYVFIRVGHNFIGKGHRLNYTVIYILIALIYPVSNFFSEDYSGFPVSMVAVVANYILPFYLYLFLFVMVFDIFLFFNLIFKLVPSEKLENAGFKVKGLTVILICSIALVIAGIINFNTIRTTEYKIDIPARSSAIRHLKIAFVADLHLKKESDNHFVERFAEKLKKINPDLMVFGGDIIEGDRNDENLFLSEKVLSGIKAKYGVFAVLGNHEHYAGQDKGSFFDRAGIKVLCDSNIVLNNSFNLLGRNDSHIRTRKQIDELLKSVNDALPVILIDHRPTEIEQVSRTSVDVQLSGHTHNGQLFPINFITGRVYELSMGYRKIGSTHFFVTSGIRLWGPPVRTTGKSEIMVIEINFLK